MQVNATFWLFWLGEKLEWGTGTDAGVCLCRVGAAVVTSVANEEEEGNIGDGGGGKKARNERGRRKEETYWQGTFGAGSVVHRKCFLNFTQSFPSQFFDPSENFFFFSLSRPAASLRGKRCSPCFSHSASRDRVHVPEGCHYTHSLSRAR